MTTQQNEGLLDPPEAGMYKLNVDASVTNHGEAACRGILRNRAGFSTIWFAKRLGSKTVIEAELLAIKYRLDTAWDHGYYNIMIESDSLEAVNLITSTAQVTHPLFTTIEEIQRRLHKRWNVMVCHTVRESNECADAIAHYAHNVRDNLELRNDIPEFLDAFLEKDRINLWLLKSL